MMTAGYYELIAYGRSVLPENGWDPEPELTDEQLQKPEKAGANRQSPQKTDPGARAAGEKVHTRYLENAYGSLTFQVKHGKAEIKASRKQEFQEPIHRESREKFNEDRVRTRNLGPGKMKTDSHDTERSAAVYIHRQSDCSPERVFRDLKKAAAESDQLTLRQMLPADWAVQKKIFQNLKFTIEETRAEKRMETEKSEDFRRRAVKINPEAEPLDDGEEDEDGNFNNPKRSTP